MHLIRILVGLFFVFLGGSYINIVKTYYPIAFLVMLSVWIGYYVHKKIPEDLFKRLIIIAITLIGTFIRWSTFFKGLTSIWEAGINEGSPSTIQIKPPFTLKGDVHSVPPQPTLYSRTLFFELQWQKLVRILPCICANFWLNQNMAKLSIFPWKFYLVNVWL